MITFATVDDLEALLQVSISNADSAQRALEAATAAIVNYTKQQLVYVEDDELTLSARPYTVLLMLPETPVLGVSSVVEDEVELTVSDDFVWDSSGLLVRIGRPWVSGFQKLAVTYSHGYPTIPPIVREVCARSAVRGYQAGLRAAASGGLPGVVSEAVPDYSVSYTADTSPGSGGLMLGVSAPPFLLPSEKEMLNAFRVKP